MNIQHIADAGLIIIQWLITQQCEHLEDAALSSNAKTSELLKVHDIIVVKNKTYRWVTRFRTMSYQGSLSFNKYIKLDCSSEFLVLDTLV